MLKQYVLNAEAKWRIVFGDIMHCRTEEGGPAGFTKEEFHRYIREFLKSKSINDVQINDMFADINVTGKDFITEAVFVKEMSKAPRRQAFEAAFNMKDVNRDGQLSREEIANCFAIVGARDEIVKKFFSQADINKDGFVSKAEFMKMV